MSIGEIISTPTGLAVVTEVLQQTLNIGEQTLIQVVSQPLTGGPSYAPSTPNASPSSLPGGGIPYRSLEAQAATAYVAFVVEETQEQAKIDAAIGATNTALETQDRTLGILLGSDSDSGSESTSGPGSDATSSVSAHASASTAYQMTQTLSSPTGSTIDLMG